MSRTGGARRRRRDGHRAAARPAPPYGAPPPPERPISPERPLPSPQPICPRYALGAEGEAAALRRAGGRSGTHPRGGRGGHRRTTPWKTPALWFHGPRGVGWSGDSSRPPWARAPCRWRRTPRPHPAASGRDRDAGPRALAEAERQIGVPYAWGGGDRLGPGPGFCAGPNGYLDGACAAERTIGFDCSGLALYAWYRASGGTIDLPHHTTAQYDAGRPVDRAELRPGDLLFFSRPEEPLHHVGIYAGDAAMVHAERTGTPVARLHDVFRHPRWGREYAGAVRPVAP
ncbi:MULTISPECIES: C40 family peptidase [Streptomyces]|uniref:C40 family peptidase n=1 Tax=Streptomyces TaxID=1883 RepID=UPI000B9E0FA3|nr:C40 family peptidase [Streptomyces kasugaensis]